MIHFGIDPGKDGAVAVLLGSNLRVFTISKDMQGFFHFFRSMDGLFQVYQEDVHAVFRARASSTFAFGRNVGFWDGVFFLKAPTLRMYIKPTVWQEGLGLTIPRPNTKGLTEAKKRKVLAEHKKNIKQASIRSAQDFAGFRIVHDGIADAINILRYGIQM